MAGRKRVLKRVEVTWNDAHSVGDESTWIAFSDFEREMGQPAPCRSMGFLFKNDGIVVALAATVGLDDDGKVVQVSGTMVIPKGMVLKIRELK